jgi:glucose/arabinose dehydrogenase
MRLLKACEYLNKCFGFLILFGFIALGAVGGCNSDGNGGGTRGESGSVVNRPVINEPRDDGQIAHPADVHMETSDFSASEPGLTHVCSDWEIRTVEPGEVVWETICIGGVEKVHSHLGDGTFKNSHEGRQLLFFDTDYILRTRHRSSSVDPSTEWSDWAERRFRTSSATEIIALELDDIIEEPNPRWVDSFGEDIILPGSDNPPRLSIVTILDDLILEFSGLDGFSNAMTNPPDIEEHLPVRVIFDAGNIGQELVLPESSVSFVDDEGIERNIYLPAVSVPPAEEEQYWVSVAGSTYVASAGQTEPDFSTLARGSPVPWSVIQPGFRVELVATGFQLPVNIAFLPNPGNEPDDPLFYVTELYGTIKVVSNDGTVSDYATDLLNFNPTGKFPGSGEQGLIGIVVEPNTGDVFASMLYSIDPLNEEATHYPKVMRYQSEDGGRTASSEIEIIDLFPESQGQSHQISNLTIGADGKLYVHMGDGFNASTARNPDSFRGKILRMNLDGSAPEDNPFFNAGDGINATDYIYALGFRNPFGGAWSPVDGFLFEVENGPITDRLVRVVPGEDYGWQGSNDDMFISAIYNWTPSAAPVNMTFIRQDVFDGSGFPDNKINHAFVSESGPTFATGPQENGKRISEFVLDAGGTLISGPIPIIEYDGPGKATVAGIEAGPDGLYFSGLYKDLDIITPIDPGASIYKIVFIGE